MDQNKLDEYEDKWLTRVQKYHDTKATSVPVHQES